MCITALAMIGVCAVLLARSQRLFRLGNPGLKIVAEPAHDTKGAPVGTNQVYLPPEVPGYQSKETPVTQVEIDSLPKDTVFGRRQYIAANGMSMHLSVVLMGKDRTSIHKPEYCLPGQGFSIDHGRSEVTSIEIPKPRPYSLPVWKIVASKRFKDADGRERNVSALYVVWFVADGQLTASHLQRMFWMGRDLVRTGTLQRWAYVSCLALCVPGEEDAAFSQMKAFLSAAVPEFQTTTGTGSTRAEAKSDRVAGTGEAFVSGAK